MSLTRTVCAGMFIPYPSVVVEHMTFILFSLKAISTAPRCWFISPAWWNAIPFSMSEPSLTHCSVGLSRTDETCLPSSIRSVFSGSESPL